TAPRPIGGAYTHAHARFGRISPQGPTEKGRGPGLENMVSFDPTGIDRGVSPEASSGPVEEQQRRGRQVWLTDSCRRSNNRMVGGCGSSGRPARTITSNDPRAKRNTTSSISTSCSTASKLKPSGPIQCKHQGRHAVPANEELGNL